MSENGQIGHLECQMTYNNGQRTGLYVRWYRNGQLEYRVNQVGTKKHGIEESWYEYSNTQTNQVDQAFLDSQTSQINQNGQLEYRRIYVDGIKHHLQEYWYSNGQLRYRLNYVNGRKHGLQEHWRKNGQYVFKRQYNMGNIIQHFSI